MRRYYYLYYITLTNQIKYATKNKKTRHIKESQIHKAIKYSIEAISSVIIAFKFSS